MKNHAGKERWIIIKDMPRRQDFNPRFQSKNDNDVQENIRLARLRSETMMFTADEIVMSGLGDLQNFLFSVDNPDKFCCMRNELPYLIEQGFMRSLPYTREEINNLKANWEKDPIFDLYEFPGADEYWDELKGYQTEQEVIWNFKRLRVNQMAADIASMPVSGMNFEMQLISLIAARESDPKICIKQAKDIIFEIAREQYNLQPTEDKKNDRRKLGPRKKQPSTNDKQSTSDNKS